MTIQRYRDEYSGCEPDPEGDYVMYDDIVALREELLQALENTYRDRYDEDTYGSGLFDGEEKVKAAFNKAGIK